jgi:pyruvate dehydrogenase E1 component beta subunit
MENRDVMAKMNMVQAINLALMQEMSRDEDVVLLGEDVGLDGGVFRVTEGLYKKFPNRVIDTPLAESCIVGTSIGMAVTGLKPIPEIQFDGFLPLAFDQLVNHASRIRNRSRGRFHVPMVVRVPCSGAIKALEHHTDSPEAYYCHMPGMKVVMPSRPYNAKGLLISAIRDPDPVMFFEPKHVYRAIKEEVPEDEYMIPLGKAEVIQEGSDITVISWGAMVKVVKEAVAGMNASIEVLDLQTLSPYDEEAVLSSVKKTGRVVIVQEAPKTCSLSSEIAALIAEKDVFSLEAPIMRVTGWDIIPPLPKMEKYYYPDAARVKKGIEKVLGY